MIQELCLFLLKSTALYFLTINLIYGVLMLLSWLKIKAFRRKLRNETSEKELPAVSFIVPAFNEESLIVETIQTYLSLPQEKKEIIVINDGSHDQTMKLLQNMFQLHKVEEPRGMLWKSITQPELKVLEAPHMGKAQALNFGTQFAKFDLICTMDADTIPMARGVEACLRAFASDKKLMACGGVIQVLSTKILKDNSPLVERSKEWLTSFQRIEYLRTFICERLGWSFLKSTILISGAFCMVKKEAIQKIGGFNHRSITEDFELIVRLRQAYQGSGYNFRILPVTTCYTQVPRSLKHLSMQRMRWQMGLVQTLFQNSSLFLHPGHGTLGMFAIPYFWIVEMFSPVVELLAYIVVPYSIFQGFITWEVALLYFGIGLVFNLGITLLGVYLDNRYVSRNKTWSCLRSTWETILLHFGYKQLNSWWRLKALMRSLGHSKEWGEKPREEIIHQSL
jgi:cellulose synthase/poly-beta-1,6-N-acetylglucosamine synthase-like glycosyltransferase